MLLSLEWKATNSSLIPRKEHEAEKSGQLDGADHGQDGYKQQTHDVTCALQVVLESYCIVFVRVIDGRRTMTSAGKPGVVVVEITSRLSRLTWPCETQIYSGV
jgi:hypothetical protein